eukprot:6205452-Pleurochrysis_carterae.AAC.4
MRMRMRMLAPLRQHRRVPPLCIRYFLLICSLLLARKVHNEKLRLFDHSRTEKSRLMRTRVREHQAVHF